LFLAVVEHVGHLMLAVIGVSESVRQSSLVVVLRKSRELKEMWLPGVKVSLLTKADD
jgi:hypothetical protein